MIARPASADYAGPAPRVRASPGLVAAMLAFAGPLLYVHAPQYNADEIDVDLALLGSKSPSPPVH